mgnify:CR=1 FL=1
MKGTTNPILNAFDGNHKELFIPVYQRNYDWQIKQCERLFQDLEDIIAVDRKKHFFGAVVGKPESWKWIVIDGQQRLTTVSLLMLALANALREGDIESDDDELAEKIEMDYLRIGATKKRTRFKLKPVKDDDKAYQRLFGPEKEFINSSNITANYKYFRERISQTSLNADQLWDAICRLEVMHLDLEEYDDAQRIFESLNSTGLELKEADKIRNFVLMGHDSATQTHLYEDRWNPIEENSDFETDAFIRWYLTTKTARTPKEQDVYEAFKTYVAKTGKSTEEILDDLYEFSSYYRKIRRASTGDQRVNALLRRMNPIRGAVTIPFLMPVLRAVENGETSYDDLYNVLKIIEAFVTRRFVVGIATNALNKIFATAFSDVSKLRTGDQSMAEIFAYTLLRRTGSGRFPNDAEFKEAFATKNMYALRAAWREYILTPCGSQRVHVLCRESFFELSIIRESTRASTAQQCVGKDLSHALIARAKLRHIRECRCEDLVQRIGCDSNNESSSYKCLDDLQDVVQIVIAGLPILNRPQDRHQERNGHRSSDRVHPTQQRVYPLVSRTSATDLAVIGGELIEVIQNLFRRFPSLGYVRLECLIYVLLLRGTSSLRSQIPTNEGICLKITVLLDRVPAIFVEMRLRRRVMPHQDEVSDLVCFFQLKTCGVQRFKDPLCIVILLQIQVHDLQTADCIPQLISIQ